MTISSPSTPPQQPRRTWRQWSKLARVRIGLVLMLIVAISLFSWWWPRRGMVAIAWMGGDFSDPQIANDFQIAGQNLPVWLEDILWRNLSPNVDWLSTGDRIVGIGLTNVTAKGINLNTLDRFPRLDNLVLHGRHIGPVLKGIERGDRLLHIRINQLQTTSDLGEFRHLPSLAVLDIATCPVTGGGFEHLPMLPKLTGVIFSDPPSSSAIIGVGQCCKLETIHLSRGVIDEDDLRHLSGMTGLRSVCSGGTFGAEGLKHISKLSSLEFLWLNGTSATDDEVQILATLTKLKDFYVRGQNLTQSGIDRLKKALPNCSIAWQ